MNTLNRLFASATVVATTLALGACFGGGDDGDDVAVQTSSTDVPDAAAASGGDFVAYLLSLPANDETSEPLIVKENFAVPADETSEPRPSS